MMNPCPVASSTNFLARSAVVIPALNEAACVAGPVQHWLNRGAARVRVVDNGSTDDTAARAIAAGAEVLHEPRRGYGAAAWRGIQDLPPDIDWILFGSADGSDRMDAAEKAAFQSAIEAGAGLILGDRTASAESRKQLRAAQWFGNGLACALLWLGWRRRFRDLGSLRVIHRSALERLRLRDRGFGWNIEMQIRAVEEGLRVVEVPVRYHPRAAGRPKISGNVRGAVRAGWQILVTVARLYRRRRRLPPQRKQSRHPLSCLPATEWIRFYQLQSPENP